MRYHCNECGCEFWHYSNYTFEIIECPQCKSADVKTMNINQDATTC